MAKSKKTPVSFRYDDDELELLERAAELFDGNKTKATVEGLRLLLSPAKGKLTNADLIAELKRRLK